jgi:hypothetical protein
MKKQKMTFNGDANEASNGGSIYYENGIMVKGNDGEYFWQPFRLHSFYGAMRPKDWYD